MVVFAFGACVAVANNLGVRAVISPQSMQVYREAVEAGNKKKYPHALSRLGALLLDQPVTVAIDETTVPEDSGLGDTLPGALKIWSDALSDSPFEEAGVSSKPQVIIKFVSKMSDLPQAQGDVQAQRDFYWGRKDYGYKLVATVRVVYKTGRRMINREEATGVIAHELGHLLGLDDVSSTQGLMGFFVAGDPKVRVEPEEVSTVGKFRQMLKDQVSSLKKSANIADNPKVSWELPSYLASTSISRDTLQISCGCRVQDKH